MDKPAVFMVGTQPPPELDAKFNKWYNENHVPMLLKSKLLLGVTRYKLSPATQGNYPSYLAIYLFKDSAGYQAWNAGPEMQAARDEMKQSWKGGKDDFARIWRALYMPLKTWSKGTGAKVPFMFVVLTKPPAGLDDKFNKWYNENHVPMLLPSAHLHGVTRYKLSDATPGDYAPYLALYEFKDTEGFKAWYSGPEILSTRPERKASWGDNDFEVKGTALYEPLKNWSR